MTRSQFTGKSVKRSASEAAAASKPRQFRCGLCGAALFGDQQCDRHVDSIRVEWAPKLRAAYQATLRASEDGLPIPISSAGVYRQAFELARRWGQLPADEVA